MPRKTGKRKHRSIFRFDRLHVLGAFFFIVASLITARLFQLQVIKGSSAQEEAYGQRARFQELQPVRGEIFARVGAGFNENGELRAIAVNEQRETVFAIPSQISDPEMTAEKLFKWIYVPRENEEDSEQDLDAIEKDKEEQFDKLLKSLSKSGDPYEPLLSEVSASVAQEIMALQLPGIATKPVTVRYYPMGPTFAHVTGFLGYKGEMRVGQYGIEGRFDSVLRGQDGYLSSERDPSGRLIVLGDRSYVPATDGADVVLTIDPNIQQKACELLDAGREKYESTGGVIIVMDPSTGAIRALCNSPGFDPNNYGDVDDYDVYSNMALSAPYEPGSIFKPITMAAALDSGSVSADTVYNDTGEVKFGKYTIRNADYKVYGEQTMTQVLENSINTGVVFAAMETGRETMLEYAEKFGFGSPVNIRLPSESSGDISALRRSGDIYLATSSFGQGITVTPMQMVQAYGAIANGGVLAKPYIVSEIRLPDGRVDVTEPKMTPGIISSKTAAVLSAMMVKVVEGIHGKRARVDGYYIAGKTGTAQIAGKDGGYEDDTIHSFVGFGPVVNPKFVVLVRLDRPQRGRFSSSTVAGVFGEMAKFLLQYYQVAPER